MDYSVVILTFNSANYIETCLNSLRQSFAELAASYEVLVFDNGSVDGTKQILERFSTEDPQIRVTWSDYNRGTTVSRNTCLRQALGEYVIVLDSDAYVNAGAIGSLAAYLRSNPEAGMVVPRLNYPDGRFQISTDEFPTLLGKLKRFLFLKRMERSAIQPDTRGALRVDYAISAFWMFRKSLLDRVGLLDEDIFYSPEDVDYCIRIWLAGLEIRYLPSVSVVHDAQEISRSKGIRINRFTFSHIKGLFYLFTKHRYGIFGIRSLLRRIDSSARRPLSAEEG